jgi:hypothetical protein
VALFVLPRAAFQSKAHCFGTHAERLFCVTLLSFNELFNIVQRKGDEFRFVGINLQLAPSPGNKYAVINSSCTKKNWEVASKHGYCL